MTTGFDLVQEMAAPGVDLGVLEFTYNKSGKADVYAVAKD
jgi:hypothetical protein